MADGVLGRIGMKFPVNMVIKRIGVIVTTLNLVTWASFAMVQP